MNSNNVQIFIFRHGETDWNRGRRLQGHSDIPLNEMGRSQANQLKEFFSARKVRHVFSSPLVRATETARLAFEGQALTTSYHEELRECFLGEAEGLTRDEIETQWPGILENWASTHPDHEDVRLPKGESKREFVQRIRAFLHLVLEQTVHPSVAISTHGLVVKRLLHALAPDMVTSIPIPNCVVYELTWCRPTKTLSWIKPTDEELQALHDAMIKYW